MDGSFCTLTCPRCRAWTRYLVDGRCGDCREELAQRAGAVGATIATGLAVSAAIMAFVALAHLLVWGAACLIQGGCHAPSTT